eukprot:3255557-Rhodomonas_salina.1
MALTLKNWAHWHGKGFLQDFKALLPKTSCLVCQLSKGARPYKHTAAFKELGQQRIPVQRAGTLEVPEEEEIDVTVGDTTPEAMGSDGR